MLEAPPESPYDLHFNVLGFSIRIAWTFWLGAAVFGFGLVQFVDQEFQQQSPGILPLLLIWMACMLLSILIHELGHALAFRQNGFQASIVLYHFGGLAIPSAGFVPGRRFTDLRPKDELWIALAGPLLQLISAAVVVAAVKFLGYRLDVFKFMPGPWWRFGGLFEGAAIGNAGGFMLVTAYIFPSVLWAFLNLVPVYPLDGGRIARSLFHIFGGTTQQALTVSVIAAGLLALYGFRSGQTFLGILFLSLAIGNWQALQQSNQWRF